MKKSFLTSVLILALLLIAGCGKSNNTTSNNKTISYKEYSADSITFEIPDSWEIEQDEKGNMTSKNLGDSYFSVMISANVPSSQFEFFGETYISDTLKKMNYTNISSYTKNQYGSHTAYDYEANALIQGNTVPVKVSALQGNNSAVIIMLVCADDTYDYYMVFCSSPSSFGLELDSVVF